MIYPYDFFAEINNVKDGREILISQPEGSNVHPTPLCDAACDNAMAYSRSSV